MPYETPLKVADVMSDITNNRYVLPAIQREFVWSAEQIEMLFDSIMQDYPIGGFLFWELPQSKYNEFHFYSFLRKYHEKKNRYNSPIDLRGNDYTMAVLDGQQRFTSLYIGLKGTYAYKLPNKRRNSDDAYPERKLYLNIVKPADEDDDKKYEFKFLPIFDITHDKNHRWFEVGDILKMTGPGDAYNYIVNNIVNSPIGYTQEQSNYAFEVLPKLYNVIWSEPILSYYKVKNEELDKVLNIFIRVNRGGTQLSYSDLLMSIATAEWRDHDARKEINEFIDEINDIGDGFKIDKDYIMKSCLVLSGFPNIAFKVDNFSSSNMLRIEENWDTIKESIRLAFELVSSFGFCNDNLRSNNTVTPIAYYLMKRGNPRNIVTSMDEEDNRKKIKTWMIRTILKRSFSGAPEGVITRLRKIMDENGNMNEFPFETIVDSFRTGWKSVVFTEEEIDDLLTLSYKNQKADVLATLMLLYPSLNYRNAIDIDHMYPKAKFTPTRLKQAGVPEFKAAEYAEMVNNICNLQLIYHPDNNEKKDMDFNDWFNSRNQTEEEKATYRSLNYLPKMEYSFGNFEKFVEERRLILKDALCKLLNVKIEY